MMCAFALRSNSGALWMLFTAFDSFMRQRRTLRTSTAIAPRDADGSAPEGSGPSLAVQLADLLQRLEPVQAEALGAMLVRTPALGDGALAAVYAALEGGR